VESYALEELVSILCGPAIMKIKLLRYQKVINLANLKITVCVRVCIDPVAYNYKRIGPCNPFSVPISLKIVPGKLLSVPSKLLKVFVIWNSLN
jgi:hypothetical protein